MDRTNNSLILKSSKFSSREKKYILMGVLIETIFDKSFFKYKNDLAPYIFGIEKIIDVPPYRDYLYNSRALLASRIIKDIFFNKKLIEDEEKRRLVIKRLISYHIEYSSQMIESGEPNTISENRVHSNLLDDMINSKNVKNGKSKK